MLDKVVDDCEEVVVSRTGKEPVVIVPLAEYASPREMDYLMRSPENRRRLTDGVAALEVGLGQEHDLIGP